MEDSDKDGGTSYDFAEAWGHPHAFAIIKHGLMKLFMEREDFNPENPYDELITALTATGLIHSAYELDKMIEVRYGWELLDDENIIMHSCFGMVKQVDIRIKAGDMGFLFDLGDDEYAAFSYKDIYWVAEAR